MRSKSGILSSHLLSTSILALAGLSFHYGAQAAEWVGGTTDWNTNTNWNTNAVPDALTDVIIYNFGGVNDPVIDGTDEVVSSVIVGIGDGIDNEGLLTIINSGSLTVQNDFVISGGVDTYQGVTTVTNSTVLVNGALVINDSTYSGGASLFTLDNGASVSVVGDTTVASNTVLQFTGSNINTLGGSGALINNGTILFDQSSGSSSVISKDISGSGLVKVTSTSGGGELIGDNSGFTGTYQLESGRLSANAASPNALGGISGLASAVVNGGLLELNGNTTQFSSLSGSGGTITLGLGNLIINQSSTATFSGGISGSGSLIKAGTGTLTLDGSSNYTGGTTLSEGSLIINGSIGDITVDGGTLSESGTGTLGNVTLNSGAATINGSSGNVTVDGGTLDGSGALGNVSISNGAVATIDGSSGDVTLNDGTLGGSGTLGNVVINSGTASINGSAGDVTLNGGKLGGNGTLGNVAINSGTTIAPGNSIGTLNVTTATFNSGSIYDVELNDGGFVAGTNNDFINATGAVTINGGTVHVTPVNGTDNGTTYTPGTYTIITSGTGVSGTFDTLTDDYAFLDFTLSYDATNVFLNSSLAAGSFCLAGMSANQCATGDATYSLGLGNNLFTAVLNLSNTEAAGALDQLSGEIHASAKTALIEDSRFVREAALDRLASAKSEESTTWIQGIGSWGDWGDWDGDHNVAKLSRDTNGLLLGGDVALSPTFRLGALAGYTQSDFDVTARNSDGQAKSWHLGVYGSGHWNAWHVSLGGAWSNHNIDTTRNVAFTGFSEALSADYDARTLQAFSEAGYAIEYGTAHFEPFARLTHVHLKTDSYTETGGIAALNAQSQNMDTNYAMLGLRAETDVNLGETATRLSGSVGWRQAFGDTDAKTTHAFAGSNQFTVDGVEIENDALVLDLGASMKLTTASTLRLSYNGQVGSDLTDHGLKVNFSAKF